MLAITHCIVEGAPVTYKSTDAPYFRRMFASRIATFHTAAALDAAISADPDPIFRTMFTSSEVSVSPVNGSRSSDMQIAPISSYTMAAHFSALRNMKQRRLHVVKNLVCSMGCNKGLFSYLHSHNKIFHFPC